MKMISSTSTTSTSGTMLISASEGLPRNRPRLSPLELLSENAILMSPLQSTLGEVQELELEIFHARAEFLDGAAEHVVENGRGDGGKESHGSGDQGFGDARRHGSKARRASGTQLLERVDNPPYRSEQADEWRNSG